MIVDGTFDNDEDFRFVKAFCFVSFIIIGVFFIHQKNGKWCELGKCDNVKKKESSSSKLKCKFASAWESAHRRERADQPWRKR